MFKTKLNQYCQTNAMNIPHFQVMKEGPDHRPRFTAEVTVNGVSFRTGFSRTIKEAENQAAKLAFQHFAGRSYLRPKPASTSIKRQWRDTQGTSSIEAKHLTVYNNFPRGRSDLRRKPPWTSVQRQRRDIQGTSSIGAKHLTEHNNLPKDMIPLYKCQLQIYAQKRNLQLPVYSVESVGPCHASRFKCGVLFEGKRFETKELFHTAKEAEYAAAKVVLDSITPVETKEEDPFIYKNLLQEILQKERSCLPKYTTIRTGKPHITRFMSVVEVRGETFRGQEAHTKKQAELNAAKVAYIALKERKYRTWTGQSRKYDKLVESTNHIMETPRHSSATKPVFGACNSSTTFRTDAQPLSYKQCNCEGEAPTATDNPFTISDSIQNLKAASSVMNSQLVVPSSSDRMKMKRKMSVSSQSGSSSLEDVKPVIHNPKELKISHGPGPEAGAGAIVRAPTSILGELPSPDPCECELHSNKKWIALIPKEEPY